MLWFVFRWYFASDGADIGFGVFLKARKGEWKKASQMQEVVPSERYNAHLVPEDGSLTCERPGVCESSSFSSLFKFYYITKSSQEINFLFIADVLRFDNTYSIFQAKRVSYTVEVLLPDHLQSSHTDHVPVSGSS